MAFIKEVTYEQAYSLEYYPRPGTPAAATAPQIHEIAKQLFNQASSFCSEFIRKIMPILFASADKEDSQLQHRSPYNPLVHTTGNGCLLGQTK